MSRREEKGGREKGEEERRCSKRTDGVIFAQRVRSGNELHAVPVAATTDAPATPLAPAPAPPSATAPASLFFLLVSAFYCLVCFYPLPLPCPRFSPRFAKRIKMCALKCAKFDQVVVALRSD